MAYNQAKERLEEIINQREYQVYYDESKGLIERVIEWIEEMLAKLFPSLQPSSGVSEVVFVVATFLIVAILAFVFLKVGRNVKRNRKFQDQKPLKHIHERNWSYEQHLEEAKKQESIEEYTVATRHLFLALLFYFHEIHWLEAKIWKTNLEYYEELKLVDEEGAEFFYEFMLLFDQVAYGKRVVKKEEYESYRNDALKWLESNEQAKEKF